MTGSGVGLESPICIALDLARELFCGAMACAFLLGDSGGDIHTLPDSFLYYRYMPSKSDRSLLPTTGPDAPCPVCLEARRRRETRLQGTIRLAYMSVVTRPHPGYLRH